MKASALVVGIDGYTNVPQLVGSAQDAVAVADWLLSIGVDPSRLYLHVAQPSGQAAVPLSGLIPKSATREEIWLSIVEISKQSGDRLYVFLSGHGYYLAQTGPIFLTQEWKTDSPAKNLDVLSFAGFFRSLSFRDQFFVVDACQNYPTDPIYRTPIPPSPPDIPNWTPQPDNGLILCAAASQGQLAPVVDGRGLLTRHLLAAIIASMDDKLPLEAQDAVQYDWQTGTRALDLRPLFDHVVKQAVIAGAAAKNQIQTPTIQPHGRFTTESVWTIMDLASLPTAPLKITPAPHTSVETIRLELRPPTRALLLPPPQSASTFPYSGLAPQESRLIVTCTPLAGWVANPAVEDVASVPGAGVALNFKLSPSGPHRPPELDQINLRLITREGHNAYDLLKRDYSAAEVAATAPTGTPYIDDHEYGPDIYLNGASVEEAAAFADILQKKLTSEVRTRHPNLELFLSPLGKTTQESCPNLRLDLPEGGPKALVGFLTFEPLITIERIGSDPSDPTKVLSAEQLTERSLLRVDPGIYRVRIDAPWGTAVTTVEVKADNVTPCSLPAIVGRPPLRNAVASGEIEIADHQMGTVLIPTSSIRESLTGIGIFFSNFLDIPILLDAQEGVLRAEPFSDLPWQEWDLLMSAGRLDALDLQAAKSRVGTLPQGQPERELLLIALAYAARAQQRWDYFEKFFQMLMASSRSIPDIKLLSLERENSHTESTSDIPLFRWGLDLVGIRAPNTELPGVPISSSILSVFKETEKANAPSPPEDFGKVHLR